MEFEVEKLNSYPKQFWEEKNDFFKRLHYLD